MKQEIALTGMMFLLGTCMSAQTPKQIHVNGPKAMRLVSLLASGSDEIAKALQMQNKSEIVIHDLSIVKLSTYKYDPDSPIYKLDVYKARGKVGSATNSTPIGEGTALWELLDGLGMTTDMAMEGAYLEVASIDCKIDVTADTDTPNRVQCDLKNPY